MTAKAVVAADRGYRPRRVRVVRGGYGADAALAWAAGTLRPGDDLTLAHGSPAELVVHGHRAGSAIPDTLVSRPTVVVPDTWIRRRGPIGSVFVPVGREVPPGPLHAALVEAARSGVGVLVAQTYGGPSLGPCSAAAGALAEVRQQEDLDARLAIRLAEFDDVSAPVMAEIGLDGMAALVRRQAARLSLVVIDSGDLRLAAIRSAVAVALNEAALPVLYVPSNLRRRS